MSVVSIDQYRYHTKDLTTSDATVASALAEAQEMVENELGRELELQSRTEVCIVHAQGFVYPLCTPIKSVSDPVDATIVDECYLFAVDSDYPDPQGFATWISPVQPGRQPRAQITYTGGYTSTTLPGDLRRVICDVAKATQSTSSRFVPGAKTVTLGDASISFATEAPSGDLETVLPGACARIKGYAVR